MYDRQRPEFLSRRIADSITCLQFAFVAVPGHVPLAVIDLQNDVTIEQVTEESFEGRQLIRVRMKLHYEESIYEDPDGRKNGRGAMHRTRNLTAADISFDPENYWLPVHARFDLGNHDPPIKSKVRWHYSTVDGLPMVTEYIEEDTWPTFTSEIRQTQIKFGTDVIPRSHFRLTHYGIPEPKQLRPGWPFWLKSLVVGLVLIGLVVVLQLIRSRSS